ncbi:BF3164 family lipoprotein [Parabacteroides bouchesdurhonensis]
MQQAEKISYPPLDTGVFFLKNKDIFREIIELKGEHFIPADTFIFVPKECKMVVRKNRMIMKIFDYSKGAQPYLIFKYPEMEFIEKKGIMGNGPDEFLYADIIPTYDESIFCYLFELTNEKMYILDMQGNITPYPYKFNSSINYGISQKRDIHNIGKDDFIYVDQSKTGKSIFRSHIENDSIHTEEIISLQLNPKRKSPFTYIGYFDINQEKNRMVYAYQYFKILKFMDMEGKTLRTLNFQQEEFDTNSLKIVNGLDQNVTHYWGICGTKDFVYCVYFGSKPANIRKEKDDIYIEQYDWNGNPIRKYKLDTSWGYIYIDEEQNELLMVSIQDDDPFFRYKLL